MRLSLAEQNRRLPLSVIQSPLLLNAGENRETRPIRDYNKEMFQFGLFAMHVLEVMFFVGMAGSSIVVVISFIEDAHELLGKD